MGILVGGTIKYSSRFEVELPITEEQFDAMSMGQQDKLLEDYIDHHATMQSSDVDDIDVWELEEIKDEE